MDSWKDAEIVSDFALLNELLMTEMHSSNDLIDRTKLFLVSSNSDFALFTPVVRIYIPISRFHRKVVEKGTDLGLS